MHALFSFDEGMHVGIDGLEPVAPDYATPKGEFNGTIDKVVIDIDPETYHDPDLVVRTKYQKQ